MRASKRLGVHLEICFTFFVACLILTFLSACAGKKSSGTSLGSSLDFLSLWEIARAPRVSPQSPTKSHDQAELVTPANENVPPKQPRIFTVNPDLIPPQRRQSIPRRLPLSFIPNRGQMDERVRFYGRDGSASFFFARSEVVYLFVQRPEEALPRREDRSTPERDAGQKHRGEEKTGQGDPQEIGVNQGRPRIVSRAQKQVVRLRFVGANPNPGIEGEQELPGKVSSFIGHDPAQWKKGIPTYGQVRYRELWPGIDLVYRKERAQLKYEFVVKPGADPSRIQLAYRGIEGLSVSGGGDLILKTDAGELRDSRPYAYQEIGGKQVKVGAEFRVSPPSRSSTLRPKDGARHGPDLPPKGASGKDPAFVHGFEVKGYDPAYPLVLDPGLEYATFLGGEQLGLWRRNCLGCGG